MNIDTTLAKNEKLKRKNKAKPAH